MSKSLLYYYYCPLNKYKSPKIDLKYNFNYVAIKMMFQKDVNFNSIV